MVDTPEFTTGTVKRSLRRRITLMASVGVIVLVVIAIWILRLEQVSRANAAAVIEGVRASYPGFCHNSHILARELSSVEIAANIVPTRPLSSEPHRYWGVQCEPHMRIFYGYAAIIDVHDCTALESFPNSLTFFQVYHAAFQNYDGKKMIVCPVIQ